MSLHFILLVQHPWPNPRVRIRPTHRSKHQNSHSEGMLICDLLNVWSIWFSLAVSPTCTAAAGDRSAAGRAADGEDSATQTHTEAAGSPGGEQKDREDQAQRQRKGTLQIYFLNSLLMLFFCRGFTWVNDSISLFLLTNSSSLYLRSQNSEPGMMSNRKLVVVNLENLVSRFQWNTP